MRALRSRLLLAALPGGSRAQAASEGATDTPEALVSAHYRLPDERLLGVRRETSPE